MGIAAGPDSNVWVTDSNDFDVHKIVIVTPSGAFTGINVDRVLAVVGEAVVTGTFLMLGARLFKRKESAG